ncbi:MAG: ATP synthase F1 subunit delta [Rickettsiaceae bacterium H1]|nr:ATP synthase F1 subunit delta [Rickettsiaceae bacterium H1]
MSIIISRYAQALYQAVSEAKDDKVENDMVVLNELISQNKKLNSLLHNPRKKKEIISKITENMSILTVNFCKILTKNNRLNLLQSIAKKFLQILKEKRDEIDVIVTSTLALTKNYLQKIKNFLAIKKNVNIVNHIDKSILGGIIIRHGYTILDLSSKHKLEIMKQISKKEVLTWN